MALSESIYINLVEATLNSLCGMIERIDEEDVLEIEQSSGMLHIELPSGKQFVINRQTPTRQIWVSSPLSGGLRFDYHEQEQHWHTQDGRRLDTLLKAEITLLLETEEA